MSARGAGSSTISGAEGWIEGSVRVEADEDLMRRGVEETVDSPALEHELPARLRNGAKCAGRHAAEIGGEAPPEPKVGSELTVPLVARDVEDLQAAGGGLPGDHHLAVALD